MTDLGQSITLKWPVNVQVKGSHASCFLPKLEVIEPREEGLKRAQVGYTVLSLSKQTTTTLSMQKEKAP